MNRKCDWCKEDSGDKHLCKKCLKKTETPWKYQPNVPIE